MVPFNGKTRIIYWLMGILQVGVVLAITYWTGQIKGLEGWKEDHLEWSSARLVEIESRLTRQEARYEEILRRLETIDQKLDRMGEKNVK